MEKIFLRSHLSLELIVAPLHVHSYENRTIKTRRGLAGKQRSCKTYTRRWRGRNALVSPCALQSQRSGNYFWRRARHSRSSKAIGQEMERDDHHDSSPPGHLAMRMNRRSLIFDRNIRNRFRRAHFVRARTDLTNGRNVSSTPCSVESNADESRSQPKQYSFFNIRGGKMLEISLGAEGKLERYKYTAGKGSTLPSRWSLIRHFRHAKFINTPRVMLT